MEIPLQIQLIHPLLQIYAFVVILRALMQYLDADFYNPISQFIDRLTVIPIKLLRIVLPRINGADVLSPLVLVLLVCAADRAVLIAANQLGVDIVATAVLAVAIALDRAITIIIIAILVRILMSWVPIGLKNLQRLVFTATEPIMGPARRMLPTLGPLDFSPILVLLGLEIISWIGVGTIEALGNRLLLG